jgi:hypothetical protein
VLCVDKTGVLIGTQLIVHMEWLEEGKVKEVGGGECHTNNNCPQQYHCFG